MTNHAGGERRRVDPVQQQIEELILSAESPKDKAFLLIMNKIALSLDANTELTQDLSKDFKAQANAFKIHENQDLALINQGKGGLRVAIMLLVGLQAIGGFVINNTLNEIKSIRSELTVVQRNIAVDKAVTLGGGK